MSNFIPVNIPLLDGNEKKYLNECIDSGWISSEGPFVEKFELEFARKIGRKYAIAVANGSVAIDCAITALNIQPGDEVIMPTFTIISCIAQLVRVGAKPVLVDSDPITWNIDVTQIETKITPKTKCIMIVHIYGLPVDMDPILELAKKYRLSVIEDAAEMHGQFYHGKPCGSFGDISTFSFYPNKHITTGEGGMIVTDDHKLYERCKSLRNLCFQPHKRFVHTELGWNFRMTNLQAALGLAQLERLDTFVEIKKRMGAIYNDAFRDLQDIIQLPLQKTNYAENIYWVYGIVLKQSLNIDAESFMSLLNKSGVGTRPFFYPMHMQPIFQKMKFFENEKYPVAENISEKGFYIPSGLGLRDEQIYQCASIVKKVLEDAI